ncbi:cytokine receptor common subunit gamma-like isoform X2 [Melanotaenia boesemani]|uniref:cytokine receptor common subunit gamma-like isoform X2 n=1 Tax=Melanotaenia boesemani TaxID=1250792 RepID=UPI001C0552B5|nr:cytokine receptor common subunit gamma-like isoform X2 [Melanotaenia boesemani]
MPTQLLLLLCMIGYVLAKKPDMECLVRNLQYVQCSWGGQERLDVNYTFISWFHGEEKQNCTYYLSKNNTNTGCNRPYNKSDRFYTFYTLLEHDNKVFDHSHDLKSRVKLNPPANVSVKNGSDFNLWFYWNQTNPACEESEVSTRKNEQPWEYSVVNGKNSYCINLPSTTSRYEFQVRSKIGSSCGESTFWSDWSEPVVWGSNNGTDPNQTNKSVPFFMPAVYVVVTITLILLVILLLRHERIVLIPVVPKPSLISHDIEDWFQFSKGLTDGFKANYDERACSVREYTYMSRSDSESSDSSNLSAITDQTNCSITIAVNDTEDPSAPFISSSTSSEEMQ